MAVEVKICGLRDAPALDAALEAGADYVGLVFYPPSPRSVSPEEARALAARARGRARSVALLVDPDDARLREIVETVAPDLVQLHGGETPERVAEIKRLAGRPVIKAVRIAGRDDVKAAQAYAQAADFLLYDARAPDGAPGALPGGNGVAFDWGLLADIDRAHGFILSGGLDSDNVADAIAITGAAAVDVSSGVERAPGDKDPALIRRFLAAARALEAV